MAWEQLAINKPHLAYIILGGFTSLFMLVSLYVKQRLYIGEATVATICGVVFGPHAANLFDPSSWGNADQITLECSRIVLVVQCFAVGVELPSYYMEKHWRSVVFLLVPVMTFGWLMTSLFIWWMISDLSWLESLACAACVTATDPVLASSVVGKGKFAKRIPRHLRDLLSAESGCNDGMSFPFIYLALYLIRYQPDANAVAYHWICFTILYECVFGAVYGVTIGYLGRHAIKWAERHNLIDRESFLVFYFTLALFCAGSGSILGIDDLLVGFCAGVGFSNDGWFQAKTEESHVSNVIDLLLNLAYFVYFGSIIPWAQYNMPELGVTPWRLVIIAIFVILFRRIPIMVALKPFVPDIKTWREAIFAGHFGPIGVGAIFVAVSARAELETETPTPLAQLPGPGAEHYTLIQLIWPITTFLVMSSILVHGSTVAVFTLGKHINTLHITMSYTQANEEGPSWMNRLPRIASQAKGSMSIGRDADSTSLNEKLPEFPPGTLPPTGFPGTFLRRQREEENPSRQGSRASSLRPVGRRKRREAGMGPGGPISQSAIHPQRREESGDSGETLDGQDEAGEQSPDKKSIEAPPDVEAYQEGHETIIEDEDGNVIAERRSPSDVSPTREAISHTAEEVKDDVRHPSHPYHNIKKRFGALDWRRFRQGEASQQPTGPKRGPAMAYQIGNTVIVEDENGEVIKKYDLPGPKRDEGPAKKNRFLPSERPQLQRVGTWVGLARKDSRVEPGTEAGAAGKAKEEDDDDDDRIRFVQGGRRMSKTDFIKQIQQLDPRARMEAVEESNAPQDVKEEARVQAHKADAASPSPPAQPQPRRQPPSRESESSTEGARIEKLASNEERPMGPGNLTLVDSEEREVPYYAVGARLAQHSMPTAAQLRRQQAQAQRDEEDSDDDGTERVPRSRAKGPSQGHPPAGSPDPQGETAAERRRREAALGMAGPSADDSSDSDINDPNELRESVAAVQEPTHRIRFAEIPSQRDHRGR
ncbi:MAG: hypothetical protein M1838_004838 [Thelocarpon superellum]|nr:MAG: hypothetical protein M1838_004838 [Thelocarpon superellum]